MRQIGARQEAGKVGGIGSCGRELCCSTWLSDFKSVNTTAARYQNLSINQAKLSGQCGRLKCCLNYELDTYLDALKDFPEDADTIETAGGVASLQKRDIFKNLMWYSYDSSNKQYPLTITRVKEIRQLNKQGVKPEELKAVEVVVSKPKETDLGFADVVGQISLRSLEKTSHKRKQKDKEKQKQQHHQKQQQQGQSQGQGPKQAQAQPQQAKKGSDNRQEQKQQQHKPEQRQQREQKQQQPQPQQQRREQKQQGPRQDNNNNRQEPRGPREQRPRPPRPKGKE